MCEARPEAQIVQNSKNMLITSIISSEPALASISGVFKGGGAVVRPHRPPPFFVRP